MLLHQLLDTLSNGNSSFISFQSEHGPKADLEEKVQVERVEVVAVVHVEQAKEILQRLRLSFVVHCQDEVEVRFVVHLFFVGHAFFEHSLDEHPRERSRSEPRGFIEFLGLLSTLRCNWYRRSSS